MATPNEIRGSKNLGLIKAIHSGTTPPLNTKIIWYDENVGQKIHKYYDVSTSAWIPLGNNGSTTVNGIYTYIAYASSCDGANFNLTYDENLHSHTSIITSNVAIPIGNLNPSLFLKKWIKYCSNGNTSGGNYSYLAFADDCNGSNFSLSPTYETTAENCVYNSSFIVDTPQIPEKLSYQAVYNPASSSLNLDYNLKSPLLLQISVGNGQFVNGIPYYIEIKIPAGVQADFLVRLDGNEAGGYYVNHDGTSEKTYGFEKLNNGGKLFLEFNDPSKTYIGSMSIKIGNVSCGRYEPGEIITKCRKYWAMFITDQYIPNEDLNSSYFEGRWICICGDGDGFNPDYENLQLLVYNLIDSQNQGEEELSEEIGEVDSKVGQLRSDTEASFQTVNERIDNTNSQLTDRIGQNDDLLFQTIDDLDSTKLIVSDHTLKLSDLIFKPRVTDIVNEVIGEGGSTPSRPKIQILYPGFVSEYEINLNQFDKTIVLHEGATNENNFNFVLPNGQFDGQMVKFDFKRTSSGSGENHIFIGRFLKWFGNYENQILPNLTNATKYRQCEFTWSQDKGAWLILNIPTIIE